MSDPFNGGERWMLEAVLRFALHDLTEKGGNCSLIVNELRAYLDPAYPTVDEEIERANAVMADVFVSVDADAVARAVQADGAGYSRRSVGR